MQDTITYEKILPPNTATSVITFQDKNYGERQKLPDSQYSWYNHVILELMRANAK